MSLWLFEVEVEVAPASERVRFSIDVPRSGATVYGDQLEVCGWAFGLEDPVSAVEAEVYGRGSTWVTPAQPRDDVAAAYPQFPDAGRSGFALLAGVPGAPHTRVAVSVVVGGERIGVAAIRLAGRARERWSSGDAPLVSVVIPCCNQGRFLGEAIASVGRQTYPRVELIVVDDGSTDDTSTVAASLGVRCIRQENRGQAAAKNRGAAEATGEYVVFLDADDRLLPHGLEANVDAFAERHEAALVSGWFRYMMSADEPFPYTINRFETERNEVVGLIPLPTPPERDQYKALLQGSYTIVAPGQAMFRREVFLAAGGHDGSYNGAEDLELYLRMAREHPMFVHSVPIAEKRFHHGRVSRNSAYMLESSLATLRAQSASVKHDRVLRAAYARGVAWFRQNYGEQLARDLNSAVRGRDWRAAGRDAWVLARRYPRGLAHAIGAPWQEPHEDNPGVGGERSQATRHPQNAG
jgi:glycosyltransferase involved in cell wall biosynthesis